MLLMIQPSLLAYSLQEQPQAVLLDIASVNPNRILLLDSFFIVLVFYGEVGARIPNRLPLLFPLNFPLLLFPRFGIRLLHNGGMQATICSPTTSPSPSCCSLRHPMHPSSCATASLQPASSSATRTALRWVQPHTLHLSLAHDMTLVWSVVQHAVAGSFSHSSREPVCHAVEHGVGSACARYSPQHVQRDGCCAVTARATK